MPIRGLGLLIVGIVIGVLVSVLPLPGVVGTLGYVAAVILVLVGLLLLVLDLVRGGPRGPRHL